MSAARTAASDQCSSRLAANEPRWLAQPSPCRHSAPSASGVTALPWVCVCVAQGVREHNDRLVSENVALKRETDRIPAMKKQLETYKQAKCDAV
jgi:hypothetical protein